MPKAEKEDAMSFVNRVDSTTLEQWAKMARWIECVLAIYRSRTYTWENRTHIQKGWRPMEETDARKTLRWTLGFLRRAENGLGARRRGPENDNTNLCGAALELFKEQVTRGATSAAKGCITSYRRILAAVRDGKAIPISSGPDYGAGEPLWINKRDKRIEDVMRVFRGIARSLEGELMARDETAWTDPPRDEYER